MSPNHLVPDTKVLAIASHVVYGYVGNTMASFVMQYLGCEVSALNTVQFSNHTGYGQFKGTKASAEDMLAIYEGLRQSHLNELDVMLSGYAPGAEAVNAIAAIGRDIKSNASQRPGSFFWVLDPVMGDQGRLYVNEDVVPAYKDLIRDADLILPNQFEAEVLSETKITSFETLKDAITKLHTTYLVPHVVVTSVRFRDSSDEPLLSVIGSTRRSDGSARTFRIDAPDIDCVFVGTGDMFAALAVVRLREATVAAGLDNAPSWMSPDEVEPKDLPLAGAIEKVLTSMQLVLEKTKFAMDEELARVQGAEGGHGLSEKELHLRKTKAAEVRLVRNATDLKDPVIVYRARAF